MRNIFLVGVLGVLLCSCGSKDQVSYNSGGVKQTFSDGKKAIPSDFPLPIYPDAKPSGSVAAEGQTNIDESEFLLLLSKDSVSKVSKFYKTELSTNGWQTDRVDTMGGDMVNFAAHRNGLEASVMVSKEGKKTSISLAVGRAMGQVPLKVEDQNYTPDKLTPPTD